MLSKDPSEVAAISAGPFPGEVLDIMGAFSTLLRIKMKM
jgi:hypothetical protein